MANNFNVGDKVRTRPGAPVNKTRYNGKVKYVACSLATTAGGKTCDKKTCAHLVKDHVWVLWPSDLTTVSYHYSDLEYDASQPTKPGSNTLPSAEDMKKSEAKTGDSNKDAYLEKAKQAIKNAVDPKPPTDIDFWRGYHGFTKVKYDRSGRPFIYETQPVAMPPNSYQ